MSCRFNIFQAFQIILILISIPKLCKSDLVFQQCRLNSDICVFSVMSSFFDDPIIFKSNKSDGIIKDIFFDNTKVPPLQKIFTYFPYLEEFAVGYSEDVTEIKNSDFVNGTNLKSIRLLHTKLEELPEELFVHAPEISEVRFEYSLISKIHPNTFVGTSNLTYLSLRHNLIKNITSDIFSSLQQLEYLDLSFNRIETLKNDIFKNNPNLSIIRLNNNRITNFDSNTFMQFYLLDTLDLSYNSIGSLSVQRVRNLVVNKANLRELHITFIAINIKANNNYLKGIDIHDPLILRTVEIRNNSVEDIGNFSNTNSFIMEHLDLSGNNLKEINAGQLYSLSNLEVLKLSATNIRNLTDETFIFQSDLKELDLSHNFLEHVTQNLLKPLTSLEKLNLVGNRLKSFDYESLHDTHPALTEILIQDNSWNCSYLTKMLHYLENCGIQSEVDLRHINQRDKYHVSGIFCESEKSENNSEIIETESDLEKQYLRLSVTHQAIPSTEGRTSEVLIILTFLIALVLILIQIAKFMRSTIPNNRFIRRFRYDNNMARFDEETEHL